MSTSTEATEVDDGSCFVCHGTGHWARECTSLPSIYLTNDAPRCYRCNGIGHFARFCPTSVKQFRYRQRRNSLPAACFPDWGNYYSDVFSYPLIQDQIFLIRPEFPGAIYNSPSTEEGEEGFLSDCSAVEYIVEERDHPFFHGIDGAGLPDDKQQVVEVSVKTGSNNN